jgi:transcriptional regulator with XRE-family HTH domain
MKKYYNIPLFRKEKGYTQEQMAEKLGISQNAYNKIENGKSNVKAETLKKIAVILGKKTDDLMDEDDKSCHIEQHNPQNSVGNVGNDVTYNQHDFDKERAVWQALVDSLHEVITTKSEVITTQINLIMMLQKNDTNL